MLKSAVQGFLGNFGYRVVSLAAAKRHGLLAPAPNSVPAPAASPPTPAPPPAPPPAAAVPEQPPAPDPQTKTDFYAPVYDFDGLRNDPKVIHNHDFLADPRFVKAYKRGIKAQKEDQHYYWRAYVALWCASQAVKLPGDFVECGVWKGFLSSAIMEYLGWNSLSKTFYLFDTWCGIDETQVTEEEKGRLCLEHHRKHYTPNFAQAQANFREFKNVVMTQGSVPASLREVDIPRVAYLSLDMNNVTPEVAAATYFWDRLVPGGVILLDDYGFVSYENQKKGFNAFAKARGVEVLALPTGQGLIIKN